MKDLVFEVYLLFVNYRGEINDKALMAKTRHYPKCVVQELLDSDLQNEMVLVVDTRQRSAEATFNKLSFPLERLALLQKLEKGEHVV